jgi:hypothetical protein
MKPLTEEDMVVARKFFKRQHTFWRECWVLMKNKHDLGGDMPAIMFFI